MATKENLQYLQQRLSKIIGPECTLAAGVLNRAMDDVDRFDGDPIFAHDVFQEVWDHVSRALDYGEAEREDRVMLEAIEAEMAGHVLNFRMQQNMFVSRGSEPSAPQRILELLHRPPDR